jgi:hypothetical protein
MAAILSALFDKSFLQSLSIDDSVWFDQYFRAVACPIFFAETLADLAKPGLEGEEAQRLVGVISSKFPERNISPCAFHVLLARQDLFGPNVPLDGRIPRSGGRHVDTGDGIGVIFDQSPEELALRRWQKGAFLEVEQLHATGWRKALAEMNLSEIAKSVRQFGINGQTCKSLEDARTLADRLVASETPQIGTLRMVALALGVAEERHAPLIERWKDQGRPSLDRFAPYAAFVLRVEFFFQAALAARLISPDRPSNRMDVAYLSYLPFCNVFVSGDSLHKRCAPLFLRADQEFVWGLDLKSDLSKINSHFAAFPEEEKERGLFQFATEPPDGTLTRSLIERRFPGSIPHNTDNLALDRLAKDPAAEKRLVDYLMSKMNGPEMRQTAVSSYDDLKMVSVKSRMSQKRGQWYQLPKNFKADDRE